MQATLQRMDQGCQQVVVGHRGERVVEGGVGGEHGIRVLLGQVAFGREHEATQLLDLLIARPLGGEADRQHLQG